MSQKKIIIILVGTLLFITILIVIVQNLRRQPSDEVSISTPKQVITQFPTGIIADPSEIGAQELDIIAVSPQDQATKVSQTLETLNITFSRPMTESEIRFLIDPNPIYETLIEGNLLTIAFEEALKEGTLYTYTIRFTSDENKIRTFRFVTDGTLAETLPDTYDATVFEESDAYDRENYPDIYLSNFTPFENEYFAIQSYFQEEEPQHFYFLVQSKISDQQTVEQSLDAWIQLQGLSSEQIQSLDIRFI